MDTKKYLFILTGSKRTGKATLKANLFERYGIENVVVAFSLDDVDRIKEEAKKICDESFVIGLNHKNVSIAEDEEYDDLLEYSDTIVDAALPATLLADQVYGIICTYCGRSPELILREQKTGNKIRVYYGCDPDYQEVFADFFVNDEENPVAMLGFKTVFDDDIKPHSVPNEAQVYFWGKQYHDDPTEIKYLKFDETVEKTVKFFFEKEKEEYTVKISGSSQKIKGLFDGELKDCISSAVDSITAKPKTFVSVVMDSFLDDIVDWTFCEEENPDLVMNI